jgi:hypothetical protein
MILLSLITSFIIPFSGGLRFRSPRVSGILSDLGRTDSCLYCPPPSSHVFLRNKLCPPSRESIILGCFRIGLGIHLIGFRFIERLMRSFLIVKLDIASYPFAQRARVLIFIEVDTFEVSRIGKVRALIAVHDLRLTDTECTLQTSKNKALRKLIIDSFTAVPIDDVEQVNEAFCPSWDT